MDHTYRFVLETVAQGSSGSFGIATGAESNILNGASPEGDSSGFQAFAARSAQQAVNQTVINPLNQATGGIASPAIRLGKAVAGGAGKAAIGGAAAMVAVAAIKLTVNLIEARITKLEAEVDKLNEIDNSRIRAGYVTQETFYKRDFLWGTTIDRSK